MLSLLVLILAVALDCESGEPLGAPPVDREATYGTGPHAVDPARDVIPTPDASHESMRCVNPRRSNTPPQVEQAPYKPHVQPKPKPPPEPAPPPPTPGQRLKLK